MPRNDQEGVFLLGVHHMNNSATKISSKSLGESKRHERSVVASCLATRKESVDMRDASDHDLETQDGDAQLAPVPRFSRRLLLGTGKSRGKRTQEIVTLLGGAFSTSITKNAATASVITLTASSFSDYTAFAGLYDEVTLVSGDIWFTYNSTGMASSTDITGAAAWDGADGATPNGFTDLITYRDHYGPFSVTTGGSMFSSTGTNFPPARGGASGFYHFSFMPSRMGKRGLDRRPELSVNSVTPINTWLSVNTSNINFGYLKLYLSNPAAANAGTLGVTVRVKVGFKLRAG